MVVDDARGGDASHEAGAELRTLYDRWSPLVFTFALERVGGVTEAEEVTQQVFTRAWGAGPLPDATSPRAAVWLVGLAGSAIDGPEGGTVPASSAAASEEDLVRRESKPPRLTELLVSDELSRLGAVREQVLRMALTDHLTSAQIAERTQLPVDDVTQHLTSALSTLRDRLAMDDDDAR